MADLMTLAVKFFVDKSEYDKALSDATESAKDFSNRTDEMSESMDNAGEHTSVFAEILKADLVKKGIELAIDGIKMLGTAAKDFITDAINNYADYEQLVGGVETLFKDSADAVKGYASEAYKTSGLSANEYMETVTGFSASLIQSLNGDTKVAADLANTAIIDMADNANKMGSDISSIQNAYSGFAKQNYTMLDNLKLGYGGTKAEMERLLEDAEKISGFKYDISSYSDIIDAIHVVQTELGITGTTAKEANETISGSVSSLKSAWSNLVTGIADENANLEELIDNVVESAITVIGNLVPRISQILKGMAKLIEEMAPIVIEEIFNLTDELLPQVLSAIGALINAIIKTFNDNGDAFTDAAMGMLLMLIDGFAKALPDIISTIVDIIIQIVDTLTDPDYLSMIIDAAIEIIISLVEGLTRALPKLVEMAPKIIINLATAIIENAPKLVQAGIQLIILLIQGWLSYIGAVIEAWAKIFDAIASIIGTIIKSALSWGQSIINSLISGFSKAWKGLTDILKSLWEAIKGAFETIIKGAITWGGNVIANFTKGIVERFKTLAEYLRTIGERIRDFFKGLIDAGLNWGKDLITNFINGIGEMWNALKRRVTDVGNLIKSFLGFSEPDVGPLSDFHTYAPDMMRLFAKGIRDNEDVITDAINDSFDFAPKIAQSQSDFRGTGQEIIIPQKEEPRMLNIIFKLADDTELGRALYRLYNEEVQRVGVRIAGGIS